MDLLEYCKKESMRYAGYPILATELDDDQFASEVMDPAIHEYYIHAPYEWQYEFKASGKGNHSIAVPDLATVHASFPAGVTAEHIGLTGFFFSMGAPGSGTAPIGGGTIVDTFSDIELSRLDATVVDMTLPDAMFKFDPLTTAYDVFTPTNGKCSMTFGYRFDTWAYIPKSHAIAFCKISTKKYLELLISGRSSIVISSDVTLDITALQQKLDLINETFDDDIHSIVTPFLVWT